MDDLADLREALPRELHSSGISKPGQSAHRDNDDTRLECRILIVRSRTTDQHKIKYSYEVFSQ